MVDYSLAAAVPGFVVVLLAAAGCGMVVLRAMGAASDSLTERFVMGSAIGLGMLAYAILVVGLLGWLRPPVLFALVLLQGVVGARDVWVGLQQGISNCKVTIVNLQLQSAGHAFAAVLVGYCLYVAGCTLVGALAPPNGDDWDSLAYHLAAPKIYLTQGRIAFIPYDSHTNFPFTMEMLYTLGLTYGGAPGAKLFHWAAGWLTALGIAAFCRRLFPTGASGVSMPLWGPALAAALFLSIPQVQWQATTAYIDLGTTLFQFLALVAFVYAVSGVQGFRGSGVQDDGRGSASVPACVAEAGGDARAPRNGSLSWLVVCGLMSGWAMGTKMTALIPFGLLVLAAAVWAVVGGSGVQAFRRSGVPKESPGPTPTRKRLEHEHEHESMDFHRRRWLGVAMLLVVGVLVACPWYIKSYLWTNNPVYPFFYSLFPRSVSWTAQAEEAYRMEQRFFGLGRGLGDLLMAPWNLAMHGWAYFNVPSRHAPPGTLPYFDGLRRGGLSASFLALVPLAVFTRRWDRRLTSLILYGLALLLPWFVLSQQSRYLLPVAAPLAVVSAAVLANLAADLPRWTAGAVVGLILLLHGSWGWEQIVQRTFPVVSGQISREQYLRRTFGPYEAFEFINRLPPGSKIAFYQEARGFYLDRDYLWANPLQHTLIPYERFQHGRELVQFLRTQLGVTHVLFNRPGAIDSENSDWYRLLTDAIQRGDLIPVFGSRGVEVYAIEDR